MSTGFVVYGHLDERVAEAVGIDVGGLLGEIERAITGVPGAAVVRTTLDDPVPARAASVPASGPAAVPAVGVVVDQARHRVSVDGRPVTLSFREHALLSFLIEHQGEVHDRQRLLGALARESDTEVGERTIDVYLQRLRRRLDPYGDIVRTVRGRGYRLDPHPDLTVLPPA